MANTSSRSNEIFGLLPFVMNLLGVSTFIRKNCGQCRTLNINALENIYYKRGRANLSVQVPY